MKSKKKKPKFWFTMTEEMLLNQDFNRKYPGMAGGRLEIFHKDYQYDIDEVHFILPRRIWEKLREVFEGEECDYFHIGNIYSQDLEKHVKKILKDEKRKNKNQKRSR